MFTAPCSRLMLRPLLLAFVALSSATLPAQNNPAFTAADAAALLAQPDATAEALHDTGDRAYRAKAYDEAFKLFQRAADLGHTPSMRRVAQLHLYGQGTPRDQPKARETYLAAARLGDAIAMNEFASMAARGWNGPQDAPAAIEWATRAVAAGNHAAISVLGSIYENGLGVPRDLAKAIEWYDQGADKNNVYKDSALRLREAARTTPEQKLAAYETALREAEQHNNPSLARGHAVANYLRALYDGGLSPEEAAARFRPELEKLVATDFHAVAQGMRLATATLSEPVQALLSADQRLVVRQINFPRSFSTAAEIQPGQGWSAVYSADKRPAAAAPAAVPAVAATPAPRPAAPAATAQAKPAPRPAAPAAASTAELSPVTREAKNWQEFFAASARRGTAFFARHEADVALFLQRHPADAGQLRTAYRAAAAALKPTPSTDLGSEAGAQFVAYLLAVRGSRLAPADVIPWVRNDFLNLARIDTYHVHHALMGVPDADVSPLRALLPAHQNTEVRNIAARAIRNEPLPKVGDPALTRTIAAAPAASSPSQGLPDAPGYNARRGSQTSIAGHWSLTTHISGGAQRVTGDVRFEGSDGIVNGIVFDPFTTSPRRGSASLTGAGITMPGQPSRGTLNFQLNNLTYTGAYTPPNLRGNITRDGQIVGSWSAVRRIDLDYYAIARAAQGPAAIAAYTSAIRAGAQNRYYFERGNLHYEARNNEAAIADYTVVIQAEPRNAIARFNRMLAHYYARQHEQALADADHLLNNKLLQGEQLAHAHFMRGEILWWLKRHDESEAAYAAAIRLAPKFAERTRAANTREARFAEIAESAARTNEIMNRMDEGIRRSTDQLRAANQTTLNPAPATGPAPTDPVAALTALYPRFIETLNARKSGVALTADEQAVFANLATLLPLAAKQTNDALQREYDQRNRSSPGAARFYAGNIAYQEKRFAEALTAWEEAAAAGHAQAKINLAELFANTHEGVPALPVARRQALLTEADAAGHPRAAIAMINLQLGSGATDEAAKWARIAVERGNPEGGSLRYRILLRQRTELARDPLRALETSRSNQFNAQREELKEAVAALTDSALRGQGIAMYELARYHHRGGLPGIRPTFAFERPEHNLHLARFWFDQAIKVDAQRLRESLRVSIPATIADIDRALAVAKGREWTADEIVAALESGLASDDLAWLLAREGGEYSQSQYNRILASEALKKVPEHSLLRDKLAGMVLIGPGPETRALAAAAIAERRRTVSPLPAPGDDLAELRRRFEAGDPAAAYALLELIPRQNNGGWPEDGPPAARVREIAVSRDYAPAQHLRIQMEKLEAPDLATRDLPRAFALALSSARAGSAEAARLVADYYREHRGESPVRPNLVEAEWWYAQAAALSRPDQYKGFAGLTDPERSLASLYQFQIPGLAGGFNFDVRHPAVHRWVRELRRRGGDFKKLADEIIAYFGTTDAGNHDLDKLVAALPPELPPIAPAELARLERDAEAGQPEALRTLARALAYGEGGLRQDDARAAALYRRAAEAGDREAMTALAEMFDKGHGVPRDLVATREWRARAEGKPVDRATLLVEAAQSAARSLSTHPLVEPYLLEAVDLGSAEARHQLAFYLMQGRPLKKDTERALRLYTEAAEAGHAPAMVSLAFAYGEGKDLPKDEAVSHRWRVRAAEAGDRGSRTLLAYHFNRGTNGAPLDKKQALHWARLVAPEDRSIRENLLPLLEREVAADPGMNAFNRAATLTGDAKLAALREAARHNHVEATAQLMELLYQARLWHEAHWWATRSFMLERDDSAKARALIEGQPDFKVAKLPADAASAARDEPLEKSLPILAEALQRAGQDRRHLLAQLDQIIDRHADRAEPLIAKAQLTLDQPAAARELLDRAVKLAPAHPQAHALLARIEASAGQPYRAYYRLTEVRKARPDSLMLAAAQAELLHALGGEAAERQKARHSVHYLLKQLPADYPPPDRFAALLAAAKLAAGMEAWADADADLTAAFQLNRDPRLLLERAQVRERLKAYPGAIADYTAVLASPLAQNPQQAAQLRARIEAVQKAMDAETARLRDETAKIDAGLERVREANSPETRQRIGDRMGAAMDFVAGNRAHEAGDIAKARELWTKAAAAGHEEAAARLKALPPPKS